MAHLSHSPVNSLGCNSHFLREQLQQLQHHASRNKYLQLELTSCGCSTAITPQRLAQQLLPAWLQQATCPQLRTYQGAP